MKRKFFSAGFDCTSRKQNMDGLCLEITNP